MHWNCDDQNWFQLKSNLESPFCLKKLILKLKYDPVSDCNAMYFNCIGDIQGSANSHGSEQF